MRNYSDDDQYNEQLHDKSTQLWSGAVVKRQKVMQNLTPNYQRSKRVQNVTNQSVSGLMDKQLDNIKEKLNTQKSASKQKDLQIESLRQRISQLKKDKKILLGQIQMKHTQEIPQKTINFEKTHTLQPYYKPSRRANNKSQIAESIQDITQQKLEDLPKSKIIQLLRNTSEYQSFANYHSSHRLTFLKEYYQSSKKHSKQQHKQNTQWSQYQILQQMSRLNDKQNLGLNYHNQNIVIKRMKEYYDQKFQQKSKKLKIQYENKTRRAEKESSLIPQDLDQIRKIKQGQLAQQMRNKMKSSKK